MIRDINSNDIDRIYLLGKEHDDNFEKHFDLHAYLNNDIYIMKCFEESNIIKGFVIATILYENLEILFILVADRYRKNGIASNLLKNLEENDVENLLLEVSVENKPALELYKKNGYTIQSIRKKYYNGTDAYIMKKVLK